MKFKLTDVLFAFCAILLLVIVIVPNMNAKPDRDALTERLYPPDRMCEDCGGPCRLHLPHPNQGTPDE